MIQIHLFLHHKLNYDIFITSIHYLTLLIDFIQYLLYQIQLYTSLYNIFNEIISNDQIKMTYYLNIILLILIIQ